MKRGPGSAGIAFLLLLLVMTCGCSIFKETKEVIHEIEQSKEKGKQEKPPEPEHEGALLDNKVTALRVEEALKEAGSAFSRVQVEGSKEGVIMKGSVDSAEERKRAEEIARSVHRPMNLKNELQIGK